LYKAYNNRQKEKLRYRLSAGKTETLKKKPSYEQNPCPELFVIPRDIRMYAPFSKFVMQK